MYLKDRNKLEGKTLSDIQSLIDLADNRIRGLSYLLPDSNYMNLYLFVEEIKQLFLSNDVVVELNNIESINKDFYEEIDYSVTLSGQQKIITGCIEQLQKNNKLISITKVCLLNNKGDDPSLVNLKFKAYMFIGSKSTPRKKTKKNRPMEERKIETWLLPLSIWVKDYRARAVELKRLEKTRKDLKLKLDLFEVYKKKLDKVHKLEIMIEHLGKPKRRPSVYLDNLLPCTDPKRRF